MKYKKIKTLDQYNDYCKIHEKLIVSENAKYEDEIELLEILIDDYDNRVLEGKIEVLNPVELLKSLLRDSELSQNDLAKNIGISRQLVSDILNYRRNISKEVTIKLSGFFSMSQEAFSRKYELKGREEQVIES